MEGDDNDPQGGNARLTAESNPTQVLMVSLGDICTGSWEIEKGHRAGGFQGADPQVTSPLAQVAVPAFCLRQPPPHVYRYLTTALREDNSR